MAKKKFKKANQEGSIFQRKSGSWRAQITIDGHRLSYSAGSHAECQTWVRKMLGQVDNGLTYAAMNMSLKNFLEDWLSSTAITIRSKTHEQYAQICRDYIVPDLGNLPLREILSSQIHHLYSEHLKQGVSVRTVRMVHSVLNRAMNYAVEQNLTERNPAGFIKLPKTPHKEMKFYDDGETQKFLMVAEAHRDRYFALWKLVLTTGMRQGELLGLKWDDLDWGRAILQVRRQLKRVPGGGFTFSAPKSRAGIRSILLGQETLKALRVHNESLHSDRLVAGDKWNENGLIFPSSIGTPTQPDKIIKRFKRLAKLAGLPEIRFHDLRHTAASLMLNSGIPVIVVSRRLGHSQPSITLNVYGHLIPTMQEQVAEIMDRVTAPISVEIPR